MRFSLPLMAAVLLAVGCVRGPLPHEQAEASYVAGMQRDALLEANWNPNLDVGFDRPAGGWLDRKDGKDDSDCSRLAKSFEDATGSQVAHVDRLQVYRVNRLTGFPAGLYWDYLFFDEQGSLLGHRRRFLD